MPLYEYRCKDCGCEFEELVSINASDNPSCPSCNSDKTEKKISAFGGMSGTGGTKSCGGSTFT